MPLHLERIEWMPSPPLAPGDGPVDFKHLQRMTLGDADIEQEVLTMFLAQSARHMHMLAAIPADASALASAGMAASMCMCLADWARNIVNTSCSMSASPSVMRWRCLKSTGPSPGASGGDGIHSIRSR